MSTLKDLAIVANVSAAVQVNSESCAIRVVTSASSTITVQRSIDGVNFTDIPDVSLVVNGTDEMNLNGIVKGQYLKVSSTAAMTSCKILF